MKTYDSNNPLKIAISAGEVSGDMYAARVLSSLKSLYSSVDARGMGGEMSQAEGLTLRVDAYKNARVMGIIELIKPLRKLIVSFLSMKQLLEEWRPDILLLIDYPDFNLRLAKAAKRLNIPVVYFVPPKVWAWRAWRIKLIKKVVDHIAAIFPFEEKFFQDRGYKNITYVGHPLVEIRPEPTTDTAVLSFLAKIDSAQCVLIMAGSRPFEVKRFLPILLESIKKAWIRHKEISVIVSVAPSISAQEVEPVVSECLKGEGPLVCVTSRPAREIMPLAAVGVLKCGTCNLEAALYGLPFVSIYQAGWIAKMIVKNLSALKEYSPVNIINPGSIKEIMSVHIDQDQITQEVERLLYNSTYRASLSNNLITVREKLEPVSVLSTYRQVATLIQQIIQGAH